MKERDPIFQPRKPHYSNRAQPNSQVRNSLVPLYSPFISKGQNNGRSQTVSRHNWRDIQPIRAVYPVISLALQARHRHVCFEPKPLITENYATLTRKNIPTRWRTTLETQQVLLFVITTRREG